MLCPKLSKRLTAVMAHVPPDGSVADIGTDHGYIPVSLCLDGHSGCITAADINEGPLSKARQTAAEFGVSEKISFVLCDGLSGISPKMADTIIIAGMGGETIRDILSSALWTRECSRLLVLQPMSRSDILRQWLFENSYRVLTEELCMDGHLYEILTVTGGKDTSYSPAELYLGHIGLISSDALYRQKLNELIKRTQYAVAGLERSAKEEDRVRLQAESELLAQLKKL